MSYQTLLAGFYANIVAGFVADIDTFGLLIRFVVLGFVLLVAAAILQNRFEFLGKLFQ